MWILKMWIHIWIYLRIYIIWRYGCPKYGDQGVPDPNNYADFCFNAATVARLSQWGCGESLSVTDSVTRVTLAAASEAGRGGWWTAGRCEWLRPRRLTAGRAKWFGPGLAWGWSLRVMAGRQLAAALVNSLRPEWIGQQRVARAAQVTRAAASDGGPLQVTQALAEASDGGPPRVFWERKLCKFHSQATKAV